jgi:hypothetical protein
MGEIAESVPPWPVWDGPSTEELARQQGIGPVKSLRELAHPELWDSDEDYEAFLADLSAAPPSPGGPVPRTRSPGPHRPTGATTSSPPRVLAALPLATSRP